MVSAVSEPGMSSQQSWRPIPDPTTLTTEQLRRELQQLREVLETRLDGMDRATTLLSETVNRTPTEIQKQVIHVRELVDEKFASITRQFHERDIRSDQASIASKEALDAALLAAKELVAQATESVQHVRELMDEKFESIDRQFQERDTRTEQAAKASKEALDAALLAAKELVSQQNEANSQAADKAEQSTIKQIDQIGIRIDTTQKGLEDRLTELKERVDRGEGSTSGASEHTISSRLNVTTVLQALAVLGAIIGVIVVALHP